MIRNKKKAMQSMKLHGFCLLNRFGMNIPYCKRDFSDFLRIWTLKFHSQNRGSPKAFFECFWDLNGRFFIFKRTRSRFGRKIPKSALFYCEKLSQSFRRFLVRYTNSVICEDGILTWNIDRVTGVYRHYGMTGYDLMVVAVPNALNFTEVKFHTQSVTLIESESLKTPLNPRRILLEFDGVFLHMGLLENELSCGAAITQLLLWQYDSKT